jgi:hypothetical protein
MHQRRGISVLSLALADSHIDYLAGTYQNMPWHLRGNILKGHGQGGVSAFTGAHQSFTMILTLPWPAFQDEGFSETGNRTTRLRVLGESKGVYIGFKRM